MLYLLVHRDAFPGHSHSDVRCRRIISVSATDTFTSTERTKFQVIERADLTLGDMRSYDSINNDDPSGALLDLDPLDASKRWNGTEFVAYTQAEMDARA